jgi:hypothetical protein
VSSYYDYDCLFRVGVVIFIPGVENNCWFIHLFFFHFFFFLSLSTLLLILADNRGATMLEQLSPIKSIMVSPYITGDNERDIMDAVRYIYYMHCVKVRNQAKLAVKLCRKVFCLFVLVY